MNRRMGEGLLLALSLLVLIGAGSWWILRGEYEERAVYRPENRQLLTERFHVTQRWLERNGLATKSLYHLQDLVGLQSEGTSLIIPLALGQHNELEAAQLHIWVEQGGHLIAPAPDRLPERTGERDLNPYDIQRCHQCPDDPVENQNAEPLPDESTRFRRVTVADGETRRLWGRSGLMVPDKPAGLSVWTDTSSGQPVVARYPLGAGRVSLLPTTAWLDNAHLIDPDHARFLLDLIDSGTTRVYLQQRSQPGGFLAWLWQQAPGLWPIVLLLAVLWIWSRLPRLGPVHHDSGDDQRQMREHVLATARFDWRHNQGARLIAAMREERRRRLLRRFPDWAQIEPSRRLDRLERLLPDLDRQRLAWYLSLDRCDASDALDEYVRLHRRLMHIL